MLEKIVAPAVGMALMGYAVLSSSEALARDSYQPLHKPQHAIEMQAPALNNGHFQFLDNRVSFEAKTVSQNRLALENYIPDYDGIKNDPQKLLDAAYYLLDNIENIRRDGMYIEEAHRYDRRMGIIFYGFELDGLKSISIEIEPVVYQGLIIGYNIISAFFVKELMARTDDKSGNKILIPRTDRNSDNRAVEIGEDEKPHLWFSD